MREEIKLLEYHTHFTGNASNLVLVNIFGAVSGFGAECLAINNNTATVNGFKLVKAAQQCTFTTA